MDNPRRPEKKAPKNVNPFEWLGTFGGFAPKETESGDIEYYWQPGEYPPNPDPRIPQAVWEEACRIAWNKEGSRSKEIIPNENDVQTALKIHGSTENFGVKRSDGGQQAEPSGEVSSRLPPPETTRVPQKPSKAQSQGDLVDDNRTPDTGGASRNPQTASSPGAASQVSTASTDVDDIVGPLVTTRTYSNIRDEDTDWEKKFKEEEDERRKWEKYQSIADAIAAVGVVAAAANKNTGAAAPVPTADMFAGPGRMNLVQAGQGFRLRPFIRGRGV